LKIPCDNDGESKVKLLVGVLPNFEETDLRNSIQEDNVTNGNSGDDVVQLFDNGSSCLYQTELPVGATDVILLNDSEHTLDFNDGRFYASLAANAINSTTRG
jgi:hypothetical protein